MITRHFASVVTALLFVVTSIVSVGVSAQSIGDIPASQRERLMPQIQAATENAGSGPSEADTADQEPPQARTLRSTGTYGPILTEQQQEELQPFGAELFAGGFRGLRSDGLNPDYRVLPGDQVTLRLWGGAVEMDRVLPVDAQGNIFIPAVGPPFRSRESAIASWIPL